MNRQTKRQMSKSGADQKPKPKAPQTQGSQKSERVGPRQFFSEVRSELRKVAWPTRSEVLNSTVVVLIAIVVLTTLIFGFDFFSAKFVLFLYD